MAFDWLRFLEQHRIAYRDSGANTSKDNVVIHCPFCGSQDPSEHMSVNVSGKGYRCWRGPTHRGRNPARLVAALLGCTFDRAMDITGSAIHIPDDLAARVNAILKPPATKPPEGLKIPEEFKAFKGLPSSKPFIRYLKGPDRGFTDVEIQSFTKRWGVRYCTRGAFRGRIIFQIKFQGKLQTWTGRTIYDQEELRYKALTRDPERAESMGYPPANGAISHYLLWYDWLLNKSDADTIILTEGPFDALKVNILGNIRGVAATCCFTSSPTDLQVALLHELMPKFKYRYTLFDQGTFTTGVRVARTLTALGVIPAQLPPQLKDPGLFDETSFRKFSIALRKGAA